MDSEQVTESQSQSQLSTQLEATFFLLLPNALAALVVIGVAVTHPSHVLPQQPPKLSTAKNWAGVSVGTLAKWKRGR